MGMQEPPPDRPGLACLQSEFGAGWETAENRARALRVPVTSHASGSEGWKYVPTEAIAAIRASAAESAAEYERAHTVTKDHISTRILGDQLRFSVTDFAARLGIELIRPTQAEDEAFIRLEDVAAIVAAARRTRGDEPSTRPDRVSRMLDWIETKGLCGRSDRQARREGRI